MSQYIQRVPPTVFMGLTEQSIFSKIQAETHLNRQWAYPSGVAAFCTIATHGPTPIRAEVRKLGLDVFGANNFKALDRLFAGLSSTMTATYLSEELRRRMRALIEHAAPVKSPPQQYVLTPHGVVPVPANPAQPSGASSGIAPVPNRKSIKP